MKIVIAEPYSEEIALTLELDPPPTFNRVDAGIDWAIRNLPVGTAFELVTARGYLLYSGLASAGGTRYRTPISLKRVKDSDGTRNFNKRE